MINNAKVVCLCGSTRFTSEMLVIQWTFTKLGIVAIGWCVVPDSYFIAKGYDPKQHHIGDQEGVKDIVDEVHKRKIDLSDEIFVVNVGGYIGESTTSEIKYAMQSGKIIKFLEPEWSYPLLEEYCKLTLERLKNPEMVLG